MESDGSANTLPQCSSRLREIATPDREVRDTPGHGGASAGNGATEPDRHVLIRLTPEIAGRCRPKDLTSLGGRLPRLEATIAERAGQIVFGAVYFRAAQAYMLISMPTGTSTIFGVFQAIPSSQAVWRDVRAKVEPRSGPEVVQVRNRDRRA